MSVPVKHVPTAMVPNIFVDVGRTGHAILYV